MHAPHPHYTVFNHPSVSAPVEHNFMNARPDPLSHACSVYTPLLPRPPPPPLEMTTNHRHRRDDANGPPAPEEGGAGLTDGDPPSSAAAASRPPPPPAAAASSSPPPSIVRRGWWRSSRSSPRAVLRLLRRRTAEHRRNLTASELSGSLGDLGTFIPLTVALARERKIALGPALFWAGASNVVTGLLWDVPMCVQPMKSIAAVALSDASSSSSSGGGDGFGAGSVTAAGVLSGAAVLILGATNLVEVANMVVPMTVVCGLQIGVGLRLASTGMRDVQGLSWAGGYDCIALAVACALLSMLWLRDAGVGGGTVAGSSPSTATFAEDPTIAPGSDGWNSSSALETTDAGMEMGKPGSGETAAAPPHVADAEGGTATPTPPSPLRRRPPPPRLSRLVRVLWDRACCCLHPFPTTPHPVGVYLFVISSAFAAAALWTAGADSGYNLPLRLFGAPVAINALGDVAPPDWRRGFLQGALPQLPLTTLNSIISVCCLAHALYPEKRDPRLVREGRTDAVVSRREVCVSVGVMNLILCPLGGMPVCHGAGGLAGQHRFGARHGTSVIVLGLIKMSVAVFLGGSVLTLMDALPVAVISVMLVIAGLELAGTGVGMLVECTRKEKDATYAGMEVSGDSDRSAADSGEILRKNTLITMVTAGVIVALQQTHYGAISGWVVHMVYGDGFRQFYRWAKSKRLRRKESGESESGDCN
jgi:hypothetical protein